MLVQAVSDLLGVTYFLVIKGHFIDCRFTIFAEIDRETERQRQREREKETERERERERETERQRDRETERETERQRDRETERQSERERGEGDDKGREIFSLLACYKLYVTWSFLFIEFWRGTDCLDTRQAKRSLRQS